MSTAPQYSPAGFYPSAYRITWDAQQKEYRIALTQLSWRELIHVDMMVRGPGDRTSSAPGPWCTDR